MDNNSTFAITINSPEGIIIEDRSGRNELGEVIVRRYLRDRQIGRGGFAKCYEFRELHNRGKKCAAKVVPKSKLKKMRSKQKLLSEIAIHRKLQHEHVVRFDHCFEDAEYVFIILELCPNQSLMDVVRRRVKLTEPEVACIMKQILDGVQFLHDKRIIHRDLKLGNIFLGHGMQIKLGDFGLAAQLESDEERKCTICGTPNYIAPEILDGANGGHSYEVDVWSMGVIMYTMLIGNPPFEMSDVKATYRRIRANLYTFPDKIVVSDAAKDLIRRMLNHSPERRPSLADIRAHRFFHRPGFVYPSQLPLSSLRSEPTPEELSELSTPVTEFAALTTTSPRVKENDLKFEDIHPLREIQNNDKIRSHAPKVRPTQVKEMNRLQIDPKFANCRLLGSDDEKNEKSPRSHRVKTKSSQKSESQSSPESYDKNMPLSHPSLSRFQSSEANKRLPRLNSQMSSVPEETESQTEKRLECKGIELQGEMDQVVEEKMDIDTSPHNRGTLEAMHHQLVLAFSAAEGTGDPAAVSGYTLPDSELHPPEVWITSWVDFTSRYGVGYLMSDGSTGVYFNDATKIVLSSDGHHFEYIERTSSTNTARSPRHQHTLDNYPANLHKKATLLNHFKEYLVARHATDYIPPEETASRERGGPTTDMVYAKKWMKTNHAVLFRLSNRSLQTIFLDRSQIILDPESRMLTFIDKHQKLSVHCLATVLRENRSDISKRLRYVKDILKQLITGQR